MLRSSASVIASYRFLIIALGWLVHILLMHDQRRVDEGVSLVVRGQEAGDGEEVASDCGVVLGDGL